MARRRTIKRKPSSTRSSSSRSRSRSSSSKSRPRSRTPSGPAINISAALRAEMWGIAFLALAILTLLSLMSLNQGRLTAWWLTWLRRIFGWGSYLMPVVFGTIGLGLLMYGFGRLPTVRGERVIGLVLIFAMALGLTHLAATGRRDPEVALTAEQQEAARWAVVQEGRAGGIVGWAVGYGLEYSIGRIGGYVVAVAVLLIGVVLFVGLSTAEIGVALWVAWQGLVARVRALRQEGPLIQGRFDDDELSDDRARDPETAPYASGPVTSARLGRRSRAGVADRAKAGGLRLIGEEKETPAASPPASARPAQASPATTPSLKPAASKVSWRLPNPRELLEDWGQEELSQQEIQGRVQTIEKTLESFGVPARVVEVNQGPVVTQFGIEPGFLTGRGGKQTKVKVSKISSLADDLALALAASPIRIEAPVPGRSIVGLEVPNQEVSIVSLRGVMESEPKERDPAAHGAGRKRLG